MQKIVIIFILIFIMATGLVCGIKPQMHKRAVILDYRYKVVDATEPDIVKPEFIQQTPAVKNIETKPIVVPQTELIKTTVQQQPVKVQQIKNTAVSTPVAKQPIKSVSKPSVQPVKTESIKKVQTEQPKVVKAQSPSPVINKPEPVQPVDQTVLTPQQETILWNKWRSDLQNKIMDNVNMPSVPQGTVFKFTFNVDSNGKITNIKSWSVDPKYTPYAIQYINPAIRSLQGKSILKFPQGTNRASTLFEGNIKISNTSKYSTANDYHDVETIRY